MIILSMIFFFTTYAQSINSRDINHKIATDIILDTSDFFPIQDGNVWQYRADDFTGSKYITIQVIGDTVLPNGLTYKYLYEIVDGTSVWEYFFRKDSGYVYLYFGDSIGCTDREYKYFDFSLPDTSVWKVCRDLGPCGNARGIATTFYDDTYFDFFQKPLLTKRFEDVLIEPSDTIWVPCENRVYWLSEQIGIVRIFYFNVGDFMLQGAIIDGHQYRTLVPVDNELNNAPSYFQLNAYPNPFNNAVNFNFTLPKSGMTRLEIYNILGEKIATLIDEYRYSGNNKVRFNANNLPSGIYLAVLNQGTSSSIQKIILLK